MMPWIIVAGAFGAGLMMLVWGRVRARATHTLVEAVPDCTIAELEPGRYRLVGRVMALASTPSLVDGTDCVYAERAEYRTVGLVPLLREVEHRAVCHPFFLDDGTGRLLVDPSRTLIDCATASADGGLTQERRLRAGEEVSLVATFEPCDAEIEEGDGPYRASARQWAPVADAAGPPKLSHRTHQGMVAAPPDDVTAFLGGAGAMMLAMGALLAFVMTFMV